MGKIQALSPELIAQIAAGEVIERPSSVVKELVENALDAGATRIYVNLLDRGLTQIEVIDNGQGMGGDDLALSFILHTTSKFSEELPHVRTLGFRGEALASIASIATLKIASKTPQARTGREITIEDGRVTSTKEVGLPQGTKVTVSHLFSQTPARKKFLKTAQTEYRDILETLTGIALSNPTVHFHTTNNQKTVFTTEGIGDGEARIIALLGESLHGQLIPVQGDEGYISVKGYASRPQVQSGSARKMYFYVNGRTIVSPLLNYSVKDAYESLLSPHSYPVAVLSITVPFERIDVNVHPRKETIRFLEEDLIYQMVKNTISKDLSKHNLTFFNLSWKKSETKSPLAYTLKKHVLPRKVDNPTKWLQVHNTYLIGENSEGIIMYDQHAAHERVLFEKFKDTYNKEASKKKIVQLKKSLSISLNVSDKALFMAHNDFFRKLGFDIEDFGNNDIKVNAVPALFENRNVEKFLTDILNEFAESKIPKSIDQQTSLLLSYLACRSAVKAGDLLNEEEVSTLMVEVSQFDEAYTCPHGRPLKVAITKQELKRLFKR